MRSARAGSQPVLHHRRVTAGEAEPESWLFLLHGIYGAGRNWASIARRLVRRRPDLGAVLVDLRLHAGSQGFEPPHTLQSCAADLGRLYERSGIYPRALLGHSFGGKVALTAVRRLEEGSDLRQVWVMDSTPTARPDAGGAARMLEVVKRHERFADLEEARKAVRSHGFAPSVANWMVTNLHREGPWLRWRFDLGGVEALLEDFFRVDRWDVVEAPPRGVELHFVKATRSSLLTEEECERLEDRETEGVYLHRVEGGHWLNADNPEAVLDLLADRLV